MCIPSPPLELPYIEAQGNKDWHCVEKNLCTSGDQPLGCAGARGTSPERVRYGPGERDLRISKRFAQILEVLPRIVRSRCPSG